MYAMTCKAVIVLFVALSLSACGGVDPNSPQGKRQTLFKQMLKTSEDLGGMLRGRIVFDGPRFSEGARQLDELSRQPWQHFPQLSDSESAKPEVWQQHERFQQLAHELESATGALAAASAAPPLDPAALAPLVQRVEDSCETCHKAFRTY